MMSPLPSLSQAYSLLVQEERQRQVKSDVESLAENASFSVGSDPVGGKTSSQKQKPELKKSTLHCEYYKRNGHTIEKCSKIHGYPNKPQGRGRGGYNITQSRKAYNVWSEEDNQSSPTDSQMPTLPGLS